MSEVGGGGGSERGNIELRRGRQGLAGMFDWDPFRAFFPGNWQGLGIDVHRREDGYEIEMPVPGFRPEHLDVSYQDGVLTVSGHNERRNFTRSLTVPEDIDDESIQANVENGMLTIVLRQQPKRQPKRITVTGGTVDTQQTTSKT
jgi:HSP20 family protein